ncbi:MAG: M23 family metallopeptidase [Cyanobacteria bacterium P01_A01_bin.17]
MRLHIDTNIQVNLYRLLPLALILVPQASAAADRVIGLYRPQPVVTVQTVTTTTTYLSEGDTVGGYAVTSDYGPRKSPCAGCSSHHTGIDLATPTGTKLIAPKPVEVVCWWDKDGGGNVANITSADTADTLQLLHLSACVSGTHAPGEVFARTGATGNGTGPHLDARLKSQTEPSKEQIEPYLTGKVPEPDAIASAGGLSDDVLRCAIGNAEGTLKDDCTPTTAYYGHTDPGNQAANLGAFSYQHGASSPEQADQRQLVRLRNAEREIQAQAQGRWGQPLSDAALASALDLFNQSPRSAQRFVGLLPSPTPTAAQITKARTDSYLDPATGKSEASGFDYSQQRVQADQQRRTGEVLDTLQNQ